MEDLNSAVWHRKGKKWKSRLAILRISSVSDSIGPTLTLYKDANHAKNKQQKPNILPLWRYAGSAIFQKVEKTENVLMIFTETNTILLAFENQAVLNDWQSVLQNEFGRETKFPVVVPPKQKLKVGESTLYVFNEFFSIINDKALRCTGRWPSAALNRYTTIDGDFVFETTQPTYNRRHTFRLKTRQSEEILQIFDCIKEAERSETKEKLQSQLNPGSSILVDLDQGRRNTADPTDQNVFHRAFLRMSNRFRKTKRARSATLGTQKHFRREYLKELNQAGTASAENGCTSTDNTDGVKATDGVKIIDGVEVTGAKVVKVSKLEQQSLNELPDNIDSKSNIIAYKARSNSHGNFFSDPTRQQARIKAIKKPTPLPVSVSTAIPISESSPITKSSPVKKTSITLPTSRTLMSSIGSTSGMSTGSRGISVCSDVFTDEGESKSQQRKPSGPPIAPPRSPISLGIFEFPAKPSDDDGEEQEYLNKSDLEEATLRQSSKNETSTVSLRKKADESSLLEEIDREIKRRTREGESMDENDISAPISADLPYQYNSDHEDSSGEAYVMLRTTDLGTGFPQAQIKEVKVETTESRSRTQVESGEKQSDHPVDSGKKSEDNSNCKNVDPGVHSPNSALKDESQTGYENVSKLNGCKVNDYKSRGRRNSSRRSSSKHLSDPLVIERYIHSQQPIQDNIVTGSLRELTEETNYVNVQGTNSTGDSSAAYVNMSAGGPSERKLRKGKKPQPLNLNRSPIHWDKYDDDDKIYHDVGPLIGSGRSESSDGLGSYKNVSDGSYENVSGRVSRDRAYVNLPSPSHKKPSKMLNYVLVNGKSGPKGSSAASNRTNKTGSLNSVNSYKSDYSMIDEKATDLLKKTREQHWQRREEDAHAQLNTPRKTKKSSGD